MAKVFACFHLPCCLGCVVSLTQKSEGASVKQTPGAAGRQQASDKDNLQENSLQL